MFDLLIFLVGIGFASLSLSWCEDHCLA